MKRVPLLVLTVSLGLFVLTACSTAPSNSAAPPQPASSAPEKLPQVEIVTFAPPSLGYFLPPVIKAKGFDTKNGIDLKFVQRPTTAYNTEFATGQAKVGGSAALLSEGLRRNKGIKVSYLFNLFDFWGSVITPDPDLKSLKDLTGKRLAAAKSTTNYAMFQFFAQKSGANIANMEVQNAEPNGLAALLAANRVDAVQLWEPAYSEIMAKEKGKYHDINYGLERWKEFTGGNTIPYLGVAAHQDWIQQNQALIPKMFQAYKDAAQWVVQNPDEAGKLIAEPMKADPKVIAELIRNNKRLGLNVQPAGALKQDIMAVMRAGLEIKYFDKLPDEGVIYSGLK
ncbi:MAG: ABC transporter substrate-binding protein [Firmicutes bacterium]|nr:ABC transporter substrate-binding protein [Bacillota bacterium]